MRSLQQWLDEYGESHQHPLNKTIHWICVPAIFWSVVALLMDLPEIFPGVELAYVIVLLALLFYVRLSLLMGLGMLVWCVFCLASSAWLEVHAPLPLWAIAITVFVVA